MSIRVTSLRRDDSRRTADAVLLRDREIVWAEDLRPGDVIEVDGQSRRVEGVYAFRVDDLLVIEYRPMADVRRAEQQGYPSCELPTGEMYEDPAALIVRRLRPGLAAA